MGHPRTPVWLFLFIVSLPCLAATGATNSVTLSWNANSEPDIAGYLDLYATEITSVIAGTAPERYAPEQCQGAVAPQVMI